MGLWKKGSCSDGTQAKFSGLKVRSWRIVSIKEAGSGESYVAYSDPALRLWSLHKKLQ